MHVTQWKRAAAGQLALAAHEWPLREPVRVRMGVHTGEPDLSDGGYYVGVDLTRGARICAVAHGGEVVSRRPRGTSWAMM